VLVPRYQPAGDDERETLPAGPSRYIRRRRRRRFKTRFPVSTVWRRSCRGSRRERFTPCAVRQRKFVALMAGRNRARTQNWHRRSVTTVGREATELLYHDSQRNAGAGTHSLRTRGTVDKKSRKNCISLVLNIYKHLLDNGDLLSCVYHLSRNTIRI